MAAKTTQENEASKDATWMRDCPLKPTIDANPYDPAKVAQARRAHGDASSRAWDAMEMVEAEMERAQAEGREYTGPNRFRVADAILFAPENDELLRLATAPMLHAEIKSFYESPLLLTRGMRQIYEALSAFDMPSDFDTLKDTYGMAYLYNYLDDKSDMGYQMERLKTGLFGEGEDGVVFQAGSRKQEMERLRGRLAQGLQGYDVIETRAQAQELADWILQSEIDLDINEGLFTFDKSHADALKPGDPLMTTESYGPVLETLQAMRELEQQQANRQANQTPQSP